MLGIAIAGLLATSLGTSDPDAGLPEVSAETQKLPAESAADSTRAEGDAQDRGPRVESLKQQPEFAGKTRGYAYVGGGAWISNCAYASSSPVPALAVGLGLSTQIGPHTEVLLRGGVQLALAGCGASTVTTGSGFFGQYVEGASPPQGSATFGVVLDPLFRGRFGGSASALVVDFGPRFGVLGTAGTNGTNYMALFQLVLDVGATFGEGDEWEILVQFPVGFVINQPVSLFGNNASPDNDNGGVITPMLLVVRSF